MKIQKSTFTTLIAGLLALTMSCGCAQTNSPAQTETTEPEQTAATEPQATEPVQDGRNGYFSAVGYQDGFFACGSGGRVDWVDFESNVTQLNSGTKENLNKIYDMNGTIVACGNKGTVILSEDGGKSFTSIGPDTDMNFTGIAALNGTLYVAGEDGMVFRQSGTSWQPVQMETDQDLIGLVVTNQGIAAAAANTDVFFSEDGLSWQYENFNEVYDGMYPKYEFNRMVPAGDSFFILGHPVDNPTYPLIMYTTRTDMNGDVWMQMEMMKINGEYVSEDTVIPLNDICFAMDQIVGALDGGEMLAITSCTECNEQKHVDGAGDLWADAVNNTYVMVCGEDFFAQVFDNKQIRQDQIGAEKTREDLVNGFAIVIDVREQEELDADGYIPGSIHVPLAEVEERLPEITDDPYQEIIFYCASGKRSQKATELAVDMGYFNVYNLGGLSDWPFEIVKD